MWYIEGTDWDTGLTYVGATARGVKQLFGLSWLAGVASLGFRSDLGRKSKQLNSDSCDFFCGVDSYGENVKVGGNTLFVSAGLRLTI